MFELQNVFVRYGDGNAQVIALNGVNLTIQKGERVAIVGASGSGKSTLLNVLSGVEKASSGLIKYNENYSYETMSETAKSKMRLNNFGFVFQSFYLISSLNVYDNICVPVIGNGDTVDREFVTELIEALHLSERIHHLPSQLSGGEKQRVAIARALVNRPSVIFADEPSGNLDSVNGNVVFELLFDLADKYDQTLIYVTHDSEKAKLAERIITMKDGMVVNDEKK